MNKNDPENINTLVQVDGVPVGLLKTRQPNATTIAAIHELENGGGHRVADVSELFNELTEGKMTDE